ncbi:MAG: hypothetical protein JWM16_111 [Verrucomicrobiales bacterium]|nr:hypothetical protein [Verrucomicrobiales bacterium]
MKEGGCQKWEQAVVFLNTVPGAWVENNEEKEKGHPPKWG